MGYDDPDKQREYQRNWVSARRVEWLTKNGPCTCGEFRIGKLLIHHIDKTQKVSHRIWSWSKARREAELTKCTVRCIKCHAKHHALETPIPEHGTIARYKSKRALCRCVLCRRANALYNRAYRLKNSK